MHCRHIIYTRIYKTDVEVRTIALVLKANVLISCCLDVISLTSSSKDSIPSSLWTLPSFASNSALVSSSLSFYSSEKVHAKS